MREYDDGYRRPSEAELRRRRLENALSRATCIRGIERLLTVDDTGVELRPFTVTDTSARGALIAEGVLHDMTQKVEAARQNAKRASAPELIVSSPTGRLVKPILVDLDYEIRVNETLSETDEIHGVVGRIEYE